MKKNVIVICIDGCRVDRAEGSSIFKNKTEGNIFFNKSITYAPYTNASMHAVFSGVNGNRNGCYSYWHTFKFDNTHFKTLTEYLKEDGYFTYANVHSKLCIPKKGFDMFEIYDENDVNYIDYHKSILQDMKKKNENGEEFFLYLHYSGIHTGIRDQVLKKYDNFSADYFLDNEKNNERYDYLFSNAEKYLDELKNKIDELNLDKNSVIMIISDHGCSVGERNGERAYGAFCYDYTIKTFVSLIIPEFKKKIITKQVRHIDFLPTILEFLNIPLDKTYNHVDGESLIPLIKEDKFVEKMAYSETANPLNEKAPPKKPNTKSVRTSKWKLIFNEYNNTRELYNLEDDPDEKKNLSRTNLDIENTLWLELQKLQL
jgi:arylsulfatase A-like enzyme